MQLNLIGCWELVAWQRRSTDGTISYPLGEKAIGALIYTETGRMSVQIVAGDRALLHSNDALNGGDEAERAAAYSTCLAYFGTFEVQGDQVIHYVEASLFPDWSGQQQNRPFTLEGDTLTLHTPPVHLATGDVVNALIWKRWPGSGKSRTGASHAKE